MYAKVRKTINITILVILLVIFTIYTVFPFYWLFISSIKIEARLFETPVKFFPDKISFDFYKEVFAKTNFSRSFLNSLIVATINTAITLIVSILGAYSLTRYRYPGRELIANLVLFSYMFPGIIILIPLYLFILKINLTNSPFGLTIAYLTFTVPFCLWMLRSYFADLPLELEDAARVDGCSKLGAFWRILLPISIPGVVAAGLFSFILSWNEYMFALVFITREKSKTLPIRMAGFLGANYIDWGSLLAQGVIAIIPIIIAFMFLQKFLVQGIAAGALKG